MLGGVILVQQIEGHVLQPFLMGRFVSLHPLGVIVAIGCGVLVAGIAGALVAVPLAAAGNAVAQHLASYTDVGEDDPDDALEDDHRASLATRATRSTTTARCEAGRTRRRSRRTTTQRTEHDRAVIPGRHRGRARGAGRPDGRPRRWRSRAGSPALVGGPVSLKCENLQRTGSFKIAGRLRPHLAAVRRGAGQGRRRGLRRQPRPGCRARRLDARHQLHRLHARGGADPQGEGDPRLRRRRRLPRPLPRGLARARPGVRGRDRRGADPPLRPRRHRRRAGHARARGPRAGAGRTHRAGADRRRRAARRAWRSRSRRCAPTYAWWACRRRAPRPTRARSQRASPCRSSR